MARNTRVTTNPPPDDVEDPRSDTLSGLYLRYGGTEVTVDPSEVIVLTGRGGLVLPGEPGSAASDASEGAYIHARAEDPGSPGSEPDAPPSSRGKVTSGLAAPGGTHAGEQGSTPNEIEKSLKDAKLYIVVKGEIHNNGLVQDLDSRQDAEPSVEALLALVSMNTVEIERLKSETDSLAKAAREAGASWAEIGRAAGISYQSAHQRWSPGGKEKHRARQRRYLVGSDDSDTIGREDPA